MKPTRPASGERPNSAAPVAPVKPTCDSAWPAKVWPRSTRKNPTVPASKRRHARGRESGAHEIVFKHGRRRGRANGVIVVIVAMRVALDVDVARP